MPRRPHAPSSSRRLPLVTGFLMGRDRQTGEPVKYTGTVRSSPSRRPAPARAPVPVICNALTHPGQLIYLDVKGKVYEATADRRRRMGHGVYKIDLRNTFDCDALNPLDLARRTGNDIITIARA